MTNLFNLRAVTTGLALSALAIAAFVSTLVLPSARLNDTRRAIDFDTFFYGSQAVRDHQRSYYDNDFLAALRKIETGVPDITEVTAPPFSIVPYDPIRWMSLLWARWTWHLLNLAVLAVSLAIIWKAAAFASPISTRKTRLTAVFFFLCVAALFGPVRFHYIQVQSNFLMLLLLALALRFSIGQRNEGIVGTSLALAVINKVFPAVVLPLYLARDRRNTLLWFASSAIALSLLALPLTGAHDYLVYPKYLAESYYFGGGADAPHNLSWKHHWMKWVSSIVEPGVLRSLISLLVLAPLGAVFALGAREQPSLPPGALRDLGFSIRFWQSCLLVGVVMASLWDYHLIFAVGGFAIVTRLWIRDSRAWRGSFLLASAAFVADIPMFNQVGHYTVAGATGLFWLRTISLILTLASMELAWAVAKKHTLFGSRR